MNSPRYAPAGVLVEHGRHRILIDGPGAALPRGLTDWLVTDERGELMPRIRHLARAFHLEPRVAIYTAQGLAIEPHPVVHTSHPAFGYVIRVLARKIVWAPEFFEFPAWVERADLMFAAAAGWNRPICFARSVGGYAPALTVARQAKERGVRRLVFAHIGRPTIRAIDAGATLPFGEFGRDGGGVYIIRAPRR